MSLWIWLRKKCINSLKHLKMLQSSIFFISIKSILITSVQSVLRKISIPSYHIPIRNDGVQFFILHPSFLPLLFMLLTRRNSSHKDFFVCKYLWIYLFWWTFCRLFMLVCLFIINTMISVIRLKANIKFVVEKMKCCRSRSKNLKSQK